MGQNLNVLLVGNQNCGKSTLFNALTGSDQYVGNWPGVTVDKITGRIKHENITINDLPGLYSLSPYSPEEIVTREAILNSSDDDVILNIVDAAHIERSLSLTVELFSFNKKMVIALNMMDVAKANHIQIDAKELEKQLGCKVVTISASNDSDFSELIQAIKNAKQVKSNLIYQEDVINNNLNLIKDHLKIDNQSSYFIALSLLQNDSVFKTKYKDETLLSLIIRARTNIEQEYKIDTDELLAKLRYDFIANIVNKAVTFSQTTQNISRKIDAIVTNKYLAIPIFLAVIFVVYYLAVTTIGTWGTDYANDVIFGTYATDAANSLLESIEAPQWLSSLVVDGIIGGVGAVLGFVPQMIVLFMLLSMLEQSGYMNRVAFVLDRIFRSFGLSGRSFIPMIISSGCAVPAIMATKSIENINERRITVMTSHFVPCSAKLPIITMILAAFFNGAAWVAPFVYVLTFCSIIITALLLKKASAFKEAVSPFVIELPDYHMPKLKNTLRTTYNRCKSFVTKAGTIIFATVVLIWFLSSFNFTSNGFAMVDVSDSILAAIGGAIAFIFIPLGFYSWEATVAIVTGLLAKENVVGTMSVLLGLGEVAEDDAGLSMALHNVFTSEVAVLAFLAFNLFSTPCIAALGAMRRQLNSSKLFLFSVAYLLSFAYLLALSIYQIGGLILGVVSFNIFTVVNIILLLGLFYLLVRPENKNKLEPSIKVKIIS